MKGQCSCGRLDAEWRGDDFFGRSYYCDDCWQQPEENRKQILKTNIIMLVKHHKAHCHEPCGVTLRMARVLAERAGVQFSKEERELFS